MAQDFCGEVAADGAEGVAEDAEQHTDRGEGRVEGGGDDSSR